MATLEEIQRALAHHLVTTGQRHSSKQEQELLEGFDPQALLQSRETLLRKRRSQIQRMLPRLCVSLSDNFGSLCNAYLALHHFDGYQAPMIDAIRFAQWLRHRTDIPRELIELAKWEAFPWEWRYRRFWFALRLFRIPTVIAIDERIETEATRISRKRITLWVAIRFGSRGVFRRLF